MTEMKKRLREHPIFVKIREGGTQGGRVNHRIFGLIKLHKLVNRRARIHPDTGTKNFAV